MLEATLFGFLFKVGFVLIGTVAAVWLTINVIEPAVSRLIDKLNLS